MNRYLTFFELHVYCVFCGSVMKCTVHMCGFLEVPGKGKEVASLDLFLCRDIIAWKSGRLFAVGNNKYLKYLAGICMGTSHIYTYGNHICCTRIMGKMSRRDIVRKYCLFWGCPPTTDFRPFHANIGLGLLHLFFLILFETRTSCFAVFLTYAGRISISL